MVLVDRFGRKILLITSDVLMSVSMVGLGVYFLLKENELVDSDTLKTISFLPISATLVFIASFSIGFGPLPWVLNSELFSREAKALASTIGFATTGCP